MPVYAFRFRLCNGIATSPRMLKITWTPDATWKDTIESGPLKEIPLRLNNCSLDQNRL